MLFLIETENLDTEFMVKDFLNKNTDPWLSYRKFNSENELIALVENDYDLVGMTNNVANIIYNSRVKHSRDFVNDLGGIFEASRELAKKAIQEGIDSIYYDNNEDKIKKIWSEMVKKHY